MKEKILAVDDDPECLEFIKRVLEFAGYRVIETTDPDKAIEFARMTEPDLILLDWMMPGLSGIDICGLLKSDPKTKYIPVIMLTAKTKVDDKITGLEKGADEYLTKPFRKDELLVYIKTVLRRSSYTAVRNNNSLKTQDICIYFDQKKVLVRDKELKLTKKEYELLLILVRKRGKILPRDYLIESVWGWSNESSPRTLDTHIYNIRKKLGDISAKLETVEGVGYKFSEC